MVDLRLAAARSNTVPAGTLFAYKVSDAYLRQKRLVSVDEVYGSQYVFERLVTHESGRSSHGDVAAGRPRFPTVTCCLRSRELRPGQAIRTA
jgi:hypothetical protein